MLNRMQRERQGPSSEFYGSVSIINLDGLATQRRTQIKLQNLRLEEIVLNVFQLNPIALQGYVLA